MRISDPQRPRFAVGGRAKFGRIRASKSRQKTAEKSRSVSEAMRTSCGGRLGARNGRPCSGRTARSSVRNSDPQRPRFAVGGRAKFGRNRASKSRRKTAEKSRSVSEAMRTSCGGRLGARNGRPCSGCTGRGSVRNSDPQRPRFAVGGRAKFGGIERRKAGEKRPKKVEVFRRRCAPAAEVGSARGTVDRARDARPEARCEIQTPSDLGSPSADVRSSAGIESRKSGERQPKKVEVLRRRCAPAAEVGSAR